MNISRGLPGVYTAVQMHLHWGGLDLETSGSEHTIDGMRYFAEVRAAQGLRGGGSGPLTLGNWELHPTEPAGSNAELRGETRAPTRVGGWGSGRAEPDGAGAEGSKKSQGKSTRVLQSWSCSPRVTTNLLNQRSLWPAMRHKQQELGW